jgi:ABC-2 type transport system permease protein
MLQWRALRSSTAVLVISIIFSLGVIGGVVRAAFWVAGLAMVTPDVRSVITVAVFGALTFCWPVSVIFLTGSNEILDPGRFALYPVNAHKLLPGLLAAGFFGLGGLAMTIGWVGYAAAWFSSGALVFSAAMVGYALGFVCCVLSGRAISALLVRLLAKRKARDMAMLGLMLFVIVASLVFQLLFTPDSADELGIGLDIGAIVNWVSGIAGIVRWTPFGWPWAIPGELAQGHWAVATALFVATVILLTCWALLWQREIVRGLVSPLESGGSGERVKSSGLFDRFFPAGVAGAVAKRSIRYWRRDPRRLMGLLSGLLVPVITSVTVLVANSSAELTADDLVLNVISSYLPIMLALMAATITMWDISYDGSALGTQIIAGVSGLQDRQGRAWAALMILAPIQVLYLLGMFIYSGAWEQLPNVLGLVAAVLLGGVGIGSWAGSYWQTGQRPVGQLTLGKSSNASVMAFLGAFVGLLAPLLIVIPTVVFVVLSFNNPWASWVALVVGAATGALLLYFGIVFGGRHLDATWPEVLERVTWKG